MKTGSQPTIKEMIREAALAISPDHPNGFTAADLCGYLDQLHPRSDGPWDTGKVIPGDHANWADNGEPVTKVNSERFLVRVNARKEQEGRFKIRV